jgi:hypothetical protein
MFMLFCLFVHAYYKRILITLLILMVMMVMGLYCLMVYSMIYPLVN